MFILLHPRYHAIKNRLTGLKKGDGLKTVILALLGLAFWAFMFIVAYRVLSYFRTVEGLGDLLALRLLSMVLLTFFSILVFSNIVTSLSTFYLSGELEILHSSPVRIESIYRAKFFETLIDSSWMTLIYGLPVFIAYGAVFKAGAAYYAGFLLTIVPFLIIPAAIGIVATMLLVSAFPARRARDVLVLLGLLFFVVLYILFRMLRPEKLVDPDAFPTLVSYLTAMRGPVTPLFPSSWASDALSPLLKGNPAEAVFFLLMLWSTALAGIVIGEWACGRIYYAGWSRSQEGKRARLSRSHIADLLFGLALLPFRGRMRAIVQKDIKLFFRDTTVVPALPAPGAHDRVHLQLQAAAAGALAPAHDLYPEPHLVPEPRHGWLRHLGRCGAVRIPGGEPRGRVLLDHPFVAAAAQGPPVGEILVERASSPHSCRGPDRAVEHPAQGVGPHDGHRRGNGLPDDHRHCRPRRRHGRRVPAVPL